MQDKEKAIEKILPDKHVTEEEFQNFMHRVTEVQKIVQKLASTDPEEQERGTALADEILEKKVKTEISEVGELKIKNDRTVINKWRDSDEQTDPSKMSQEAFMRSVEKDARERAEDRKIRNERAETYKTIGNAAFKREDYEKAVTYYTKAVEQRKDSQLLWNNRALAYIRLGLYEKALHDCDWALKVNRKNVKALLNSAKCHKRLKNLKAAEDFVYRAKETNPDLVHFIDEFVDNMNKESENDVLQVLDEN